jgi:hypothetical protein
MKQHHPDAAALDRLGFAPIRAHMRISRQAFSYWRYNGVPKLHRNTIAMLGAVAGKPMPEMMVDR